MKNRLFIVLYVVAAVIVAGCAFLIIHNFSGAKPQMASSSLLSAANSGASSAVHNSAASRGKSSSLGQSTVSKISSASEQTAISEISSSNASASGSVSGTAKTNGKIAYLTFDDGPSKLTPHLLDILKQINVKATFFVQVNGEDTPQKRALMKQEVQDGNMIGIHSFTHDYQYIYVNEKNFLTDLNKIRNIIIQATGINPNMMRFPGGIGNTVSIKYAGHVIMPTLVNDVVKLGITPFDWNAGGQDADSSTPLPTSTIVKDVLDDCKGESTVIILLHDSVPHETSIEAVPQIVKTLRSEGYTFELLNPQAKPIREKCAKHR